MVCSSENLKGRDYPEDTIIMDLMDTGWEAVDWIHMVKDRDQWGGSCKHGNEPSRSTKGGKFLD